jgi:phage baseplate assembly protein W
MLPEFGTPLRELIFEPNDPTIVDQARQMIIDSISQFEPRITIQAIDVSTSIDTSSLDINDPRTEIEHILSIRIAFYDPKDIQKVQELKLELPLGGT